MLTLTHLSTSLNLGTDAPELAPAFCFFGLEERPNPPREGLNFLSGGKVEELEETDVVSFAIAGLVESVEEAGLKEAAAALMSFGMGLLVQPVYKVSICSSRQCRQSMVVRTCPDRTPTTKPPPRPRSRPFPCHPLPHPHSHSS